MVYDDSKKNLEKRHDNIVKSVKTGNYPTERADKQKPVRLISNEEFDERISEFVDKIVSQIHDLSKIVKKSFYLCFK